MVSSWFLNTCAASNTGFRLQNPVNLLAKRALASSVSDGERAGRRTFPLCVPSSSGDYHVFAGRRSHGFYFAAFDVEKRDSVTISPAGPVPLSELILKIRADFRPNKTSHTLGKQRGPALMTPGHFIGGKSL